MDKFSGAPYTFKSRARFFGGVFGGGHGAGRVGGSVALRGGLGTFVRRNLGGVHEAAVADISTDEPRQLDEAAGVGTNQRADVA